MIIAPLFVAALVVVVFLYLVPHGIVVRDYLVYFWHMSQNMDAYQTLAKPVQLKRSFVVVLTTCPKRLHSGIERSLKVLASAGAKRIVLSVPRKFRDVEDYDDQFLKTLHERIPQVHVHRIDKDLGPATKLLGSLTSGLLDTEDYIVVLDDDVLYANTLLQSYDRTIEAHNDRAAVYAPIADSIYGLSITPGFGSFCVQRKYLPGNFLDLCKVYMSCSTYCTKHDDFVFSAAFTQLGLRRIKVEAPKPIPLPIGFGLDALHMTDLSAIKHLRCSQAIWTTWAQCPLDRSVNAIFSMVGSR